MALEATKANLERLGDLVAELQRQLKPLGRQAQAARRAAVIQAELRDAKARLLAERHDDVFAALPESHPAFATYQVYDWLTYLQESLVRALLGFDAELDRPLDGPLDDD